MRNRALALAGALMATVAALAPAQDLVGEPAPEAEIKEWVKGNACNAFKDLRGKAVLIEFFATW
jgi:hypothetical protein